MGSSLQLLLLIICIFFSTAVGVNETCKAKIQPDASAHIPVELEKEFTATCNLEGSNYSADDIEWFFGNVSLPREIYKKINTSAVAVTVNISSGMKNPLKCSASKQSLSFKTPCTYGIYLVMGYKPLKPKNLSCIAVQNGRRISSFLTCSWDPGTRDPLIPTSYTLYAKTINEPRDASSTAPLINQLRIDLGTFPNHMDLVVWVEVKNALGNESSEKIDKASEYFVKPNPPSNLKIIQENNFPTSLLVNWTHPIHRTTFELKYNIRYCQVGRSWTYVSENATKAYIESFRLQSLQPYTEYVVQVRCRHHENIGYWSDWSSNVTARTPEATPESGPDLWRVISDDAVKLIWKEPVKPNGKILGYNLSIEEDGSTPESFYVHSNNHEFHLKGKMTFISMTAVNTAGVSPRTTLVISKKELSFGVDSVSYSVHGGQLRVDWQLSTKFYRNVSEYVVEWVSVPDNERGWQRVSGRMNSTDLKGHFEPFKRYNISVYPIYRYAHGKRHYNLPGRSVEAVGAYLQQGSPLKGPPVVVTNTQKNSAVLEWEEIPIASQRGFLTNYTIFYKTGDDEQFCVAAAVVDSKVLSYKLTGLESVSQYVVHIMASNVNGSANGTDSSFYTKKYDDGEIEVIVVFVCLGFLFLIVFIMMFSLKNREVIKKHLWPQVPDPYHSTIATWSPDSPIRADTPKEATLPDVSVVEVDVFDKKSLCEEDKNILMKKDKYFSEEHSSGIGGSSCMSSPRQSVSDSDEGDSGQTTASTVQYSSVVASGYKGQTPSLQAPVFIRSESTQPLLDCEEHPESLLDSNSHQRNSYFRRSRGLEQMHPQEAEEPSCFSPMEEEEDTPTLTEDPPGPAPGYMPQQNGYRPQ